MLALVTGASAGIGLAIAHELADRDFDLVIAARHDDLLDAADALRRPGLDVTPVRVDLATAAGVEELAAAVAERPLAVAALNAGTAAGGAFGTGTTLEDQLAVVDLNVRGTVQLAHHVVAAMVARGRGGSCSPPRSPRTCPGRSTRSTTPPSRSCSRSRWRCATS